MKKIYDVVIIGAGPAGLAAAIYASRAGMDGIVLERQPMEGGQILNTYEVDNYPGIPNIGGFELAEKFKEHAKQAGAVFEEAEVIGIEEKSGNYIVHTEHKTFETRGVLIATGASHRRLGVEGEEKFSGHGVSYCATCDGAFYRNKTAAVVGGGDVAIEDAIFLSRMCEKVYVIHRRDEFRASKILQKRLLALNNVEIIWNSVVERIAGEELVEELYISNVKTSEKSKLLVQGVFIAVGMQPETNGLEKIASIDENGYFLANEDCRTSRRRVYAAGDVRAKGLRQIITAVADGANSILSLQEDLLDK